MVTLGKTRASLKNWKQTHLLNSEQVQREEATHIWVTGKRGEKPALRGSSCRSWVTSAARGRVGACFQELGVSLTFTAKEIEFLLTGERAQPSLPHSGPSLPERGYGPTARRSGSAPALRPGPFLSASVSLASSPAFLSSFAVFPFPVPICCPPTLPCFTRFPTSQLKVNVYTSHLFYLSAVALCVINRAVDELWLGAFLPARKIPAQVIFSVNGL